MRLLVHLPARLAPGETLSSKLSLLQPTLTNLLLRLAPARF